MLVIREVDAAIAGTRTPPPPPTDVPKPPSANELAAIQAPANQRNVLVENFTE